ncbi:hypothetical protein E5K00_22475 [Hymenobacter aquaticus]|uniref:Uncharacterized protein n=1 Tax=Hymenobacter aquaticus TaxID=1867101 RepID=A0A4Z0PTX7_9BACT|nr:hypothetical protein [Hymenobacter aquaticus]TGE20749.1 hypothetical protein E5K00_22475 [Hymenobacter aquaticus]
MPLPATPARPARFVPLLVVGLLLLLSGCGTSRSAFQFRPPAVARAVAPPVAAPAPVVPPVAAVAPVPVVAPVVRRSAEARPPTSHVARRPRPTPLVTARYAVTRPALRAAVKQLTTAPQHHTEAAEAGLGTTVLGVLGLVVLPVSLLGLLIWGGPVWAVLAGLAAVAILVAYLDPFQ